MELSISSNSTPVTPPSVHGVPRVRVNAKVDAMPTRFNQAEIYCEGIAKIIVEGTGLKGSDRHRRNASEDIVVDVDAAQEDIFVQILIMVMEQHRSVDHGRKSNGGQTSASNVAARRQGD